MAYAKRARAGEGETPAAGKRQRTLPEVFAAVKSGGISGGGGCGGGGAAAPAAGGGPGSAAGATARGAMRPERCLLLRAFDMMHKDAPMDGSLPCREAQTRAIEEFVRGGVARGGVAYVTGAPGTGKTAVVVSRGAARAPTRACVRVFVSAAGARACTRAGRARAAGVALRRAGGGGGGAGGAIVVMDRVVLSGHRWRRVGLVPRIQHRGMGAARWFCCVRVGVGCSSLTCLNCLYQTCRIICYCVSAIIILCVALHCIVFDSTVALHCIVFDSTVALYCIAFDSTVALNCIVFDSTVALHCIVFDSTVALHCIVFDSTVALYCIAFDSTVALHCIAFDSAVALHYIAFDSTVAAPQVAARVNDANYTAAPVASRLATTYAARPNATGAAVTFSVSSITAFGVPMAIPQQGLIITGAGARVAGAGVFLHDRPASDIGTARKGQGRARREILDQGIPQRRPARRLDAAFGVGAGSGRVGDGQESRRLESWPNRMMISK